MSNQTISNQDTPDPWLVPSPFHPPHSPLFYLTFTLGNRIEIWSSSSLESFHDNSHTRKTTIWQPQPNSPWSADIWAPELHYTHSTWWIYAAAAQPNLGNASHRTIVLRCLDQDPMVGAARWVFEGPLRGLPNDQWSIDATVFSPDPGPREGGGAQSDEQRRWYVCYSGWPLGDQSDTQQDLFLARLKTPLEADSKSLTCIGRAELGWERPDGGKRGVNEGPSWVDFRAAGWRGIVYSGHGSWTSEYKLGLLRFTGGPHDDLCNERLWRKRQTPLLISDKQMGGPFGPGHASFVPSPDGQRVFCVYHGTERDGEGWSNRKGRVVSMGPEAFQEQATPMCCAYRVCGAAATNVHGGFSTMPVQHGQGQQQQQHQQYPGQGQQHMGQNASGGQGGAGGFGKYANEIENRIPAKYQGMFQKAKGLFK